METAENLSILNNLSWAAWGSNKNCSESPNSQPSLNCRWKLNSTNMRCFIANNYCEKRIQPNRFNSNSPENNSSWAQGHFKPTDRNSGIFGPENRIFFEKWKKPRFFRKWIKIAARTGFFSPKDFDLIFRRRYNLSEVVTVSRIKLSA